VKIDDSAFNDPKALPSSRRVSPSASPW